jgi:hypothetical protein
VEHLQNLSREELLKLLEVYARNWLAHDGCWFLAAEESFGLATAIALDCKSWERFSPIEAKRIMEAFAIPENGGLEALEEALGYRLYACINRDKIERRSADTLIYKMIECRVQSARQRKGLPSFPCKPVGEIEYSVFARTVDSRISTRCIQCPPGPMPDSGYVCAWEFTIRT